MVNSQAEFREAILHVSGASAKGFLSYEEAQCWLDSARAAHGTHRISHSAMGSSTHNQPPYPSTPPRIFAEAAVQCITPSGQSAPNPRTPSSFENPDVSQGHAAMLVTLQKPNEGIQLSVEQRRILAMVKTRQNVFFTGPAGTGKSVLLREVIAQLRNQLSYDAIAITASTGIAGLNIGGSTIHSFAGIGLGKEPADQLAGKILQSRRLRQRWQSLKVLVIDEISMLDGVLFDKLEHIARVVRNCRQPFGGIQLVLSGDFFQLPPVPDQSHEYRMPATFAFDAKSWPRCISRPVFLSQVFRQKDDVFIGILASLRKGELKEEDIHHLQSLSRPLHYADGIEPSQLFPLRREVESCNNNRLAALAGPDHTFISVDSAGYDVKNQPISVESAQNLLDRLIAPSTITLKVGAQVMLIQNIEQGHLVNGSVGRVVEFLTIHEALKRNITVAELNDRKMTDRSNEAVEKDLKDQLEGDSKSSLRSIDDHSFDHRQPWPLVSFPSGRELLCAPLGFSVEGSRGNIEAYRLQVPLILAWALSIHKSQGQTLTRVKVDLGKVFEKGQAYVALSRATSMDGLEIENFQPSKVQAHPRVLAWQQFWTGYGQESLELEEEMDTEEAIQQFWDMSD